MAGSSTQGRLSALLFSMVKSSRCNAQIFTWQDVPAIPGALDLPTLSTVSGLRALQAPPLPSDAHVHGGSRSVADPSSPGAISIFSSVQWTRTIFCRRSRCSGTLQPARWQESRRRCAVVCSGEFRELLSFSSPVKTGKNSLSGFTASEQYQRLR